MDTNDKKTALLPVYLVLGEDHLKRDTAIKRMHQRMEKEGDFSFNHDTFHGEDAEGAAIASACNTLPFASRMRLVEVLDADKLRKDDKEQLVSYLANPSETTVLLLVTDSLAKNTRLYKAIAALGKNTVVDCTPAKAYELPSLVRNMAVSHGFTLNDKGAKRLVELVGTDTVRIDSELKKLALAHQGTGVVGPSQVDLLVKRTSETKSWVFVDAFSARDVSACMDYLGKMESVSPFELLSRCVFRVRELLCAQALRSRGALKQLPEELKVQPWRVKHHAEWSKNYTPAELRRALVSARDAEQEMKSGGEPRAVFDRWLIDVLIR